MLQAPDPWRRLTTASIRPSESITRSAGNAGPIFVPDVRLNMGRSNRRVIEEAGPTVQIPGDGSFAPPRVSRIQGFADSFFTARRSSLGTALAPIFLIIRHTLRTARFVCR